MVSLKAYLRMAVIAVVVLLFPLGYLKGCADERERFYQFKAQVEALGVAQEARNKRVKEEQQRIHREEVNALKQRLAALRRDNGVLLNSVRQYADRSVLPPARAPTAGSGDSSRVCFDRTKLDAGIRGALGAFHGSAAQSIQRGDVGLAALAACVEWATRSAGATGAP